MRIKIRMFFTDRVGIVAEVAAMIASQRINIISMEVRRVEDIARLWFEIEPRAGVVVEREKIINLLNTAPGLREIAFVETLPQEERQQRFQVVLDNIGDGVVAIDSHGCITTINKVAQTLLGCRASDAIGRDVRALETPLNDILSCLQGRRFNNVKKTIINGNGRFQFFSTGRPILDKAKRIVGAVEIFRNMLEIKELAHAISRPDQITFSDFVGNSPIIQQAISFAQRVATTDAIISIRGESGTGKELFARAIHAESRRSGLFVPINCAALPEHLLESELFGYESGAFTGAKKDGKTGLFETAAGGTIFLDEIGEMAPVLQAKILRLIQERSVRRIGGKREIAIDARIITATNQDLERMITHHTFREDLYYRINVLPIHIPPLRERAEDIPVLAQHFLFQLISNIDHSARTIAPAAYDKLHHHNWPGNVRELKNVIERAAILCDDPCIEAEHIWLSFEVGPKVIKLQSAASCSSSVAGSLKDQIDACEKQCIQQAFKQARSIRQAARRLRISHTTLLNKLKKHGLKLEINKTIG